MMHLSAGVNLLGVSQSAAGALVAAVWQGFLLAVVAWAGLKLLPKTPASVRFAIWFAVFLVVAGLPVISLWPHAMGVAKGSGSGAWLTLDERWCVAIAGVWIGASVIRAGTLVVAGFRLRSLWKRAEAVDVAVSDCAKTIAGPSPQNDSFHTGRGGRQARVCISDEVDRPSVIGFFSPKILIPRWLIEKLTTEELRQIVLHESGHLGRADDWMNLVQKIALVVFPLNPALAWVERRLCFERELACDERVLAETGAPKAYAACLAGLAEHRLGRRGGALSLGALGRESELGRRVRRILERGSAMRPVHARLVLGGAMLGLVFGALELGRCPAVVAFTAGPRAQGSGSSLRAARVHFNSTHADKTAVDREPGYKVQAVAFHSTTPQRNGPAHRGEAAVDGTGKILVARAHASEAKHGTPGFVALRAQRQQLVVLTASDGSRVVMTAAQASDMARQAAYEERAAYDDQVPRYAAVPVRGGWLLFQL